MIYLVQRTQSCVLVLVRKRNKVHSPYRYCGDKISLSGALSRAENLEPKSHNAVLNSVHFGPSVRWAAYASATCCRFVV